MPRNYHSITNHDLVLFGTQIWQMCPLSRILLFLCPVHAAVRFQTLDHLPLYFDASPLGFDARHGEHPHVHVNFIKSANDLPIACAPSSPKPDHMVIAITTGRNALEDDLIIVTRDT